MKKKQIIPLVILVVVILVLIFIFTRNKGDNQKRLLQIYSQLESSQEYLFEMKQDENNKTIMAKKGEKTIIDQYSKDSHTTTIIKENDTYLVLHDREEYYIYRHNNIEQSVLTDGLKEIINKKFTTGTEKIKGQKYNYEEYQGSTMFMQSSSLDVEENDIRTRFYFDSNENLVYIRTIKGVTQELLNIKIDKEVDDSIFEIPANYAENVLN